MRVNMDEIDLEKFDKFIEKHWGNETKKTITVAAGEERKKRGRKAKTSTENQ